MRRREANMLRQAAEVISAFARSLILKPAKRPTLRLKRD